MQPALINLIEEPEIHYMYIPPFSPFDEDYDTPYTIENSHKRLRKFFAMIREQINRRVNPPQVQKRSRPQLERLDEVVKQYGPEFNEWLESDFTIIPRHDIHKLLLFMHNRSQVETAVNAHTTVSHIHAVINRIIISLSSKAAKEAFDFWLANRKRTTFAEDIFLDSPIYCVDFFPTRLRNILTRHGDTVREILDRHTYKQISMFMGMGPKLFEQFLEILKKNNSFEKLKY